MQETTIICQRRAPSADSDREAWPREAKGRVNATVTHLEMEVTISHGAGPNHKKYKRDMHTYKQGIHATPIPRYNHFFAIISSYSKYIPMKNQIGNIGQATGIN